MNDIRRAGPPRRGPAPELVEGGYAIEIADAALLHDGLNSADLAHVLHLRHAGIIPEMAAAALLGELLAMCDVPAVEFPYDPAHGEVYNSREYVLTQRLGHVAGWLNAGRTRREAVRIALRLRLRTDVLDLADAALRFVRACTGQARRHAATLMPDYTYLQRAQPSTFGHVISSFVDPALRDVTRLLAEFDRINASPAGSGAANGTGLLTDRAYPARLLGFGSVIDHTRDAMWQVDAFGHALTAATSLTSTLSKLADDLEIFASREFDFVDLADGYSRSSILMPQKRNPYALTMVRGISGTMIGHLTSFFAVNKTPSARSDSLIFVYGTVPRGIDAARRATQLMAGVVETLKVNGDRMAAALADGYTQATDIAEAIIRHGGVDYRTAHTIVGAALATASERHLPAARLTVQQLDDAAAATTGTRLGLTDSDLASALDPQRIVATRTGAGGAAPPALAATVARCEAEAESLTTDIAMRRESITVAQRALHEAARRVATQK